MDNEQRIQALEQEIQLLKAQIQGTLLDIQAHLLTNAYPSLRTEGQAGAEAGRQAAARENASAAAASAAATPPVKRVSLETFGELPPAPAVPPLPAKVPPPAAAAPAPAPAAPPVAAPMRMAPPAPRAAGPQRSIPAAPAPRQAAAESPMRRAPAAPQRPPAARQVPAAPPAKRGPRLSPKTRQASRLSHRRNDLDKLLPLDDLGGSGSSFSTVAPVQHKPHSPIAGQRTSGSRDTTAPTSLNGTATAQGAPEAASMLMSAADIEPLNKWLLGKVEKYGIDRTRALLDMYVRKEYLKPEVIAMLVRLLDQHEEAMRPSLVLTNAKPRFMENGVGRLSSTVTLEDATTGSPISPEAEKHLSSRRLVLRLIAGVQNAGMSWAARDEKRR